MANGTYGIKKPAMITSNDVDIYYFYRPSRSTESPDFSDFVKLDSSILTSVNAEGNDGHNRVLPGIYDLKLPLDIFGKKGIYTVYIKPKEIFTTILDVSTLAASSFSDIRGIVIDINSISDSTGDFNNGGLVGYRVEYFDDNGERSNDYRLVTSNYRCEPVAQYLNNTAQKGLKYSYNDSSNLMFCTLTPSTAMSFKSSSLPFIGKTNQKIAFINTKFNPVMMEIEMVDHDIDTVSTMLEGSQIRNLDQASITTFTDEGGIYHQATYGTITNPYEDIHHDFKLKKDSNITFEEIDNLEKIKENI